MPGGLIVLAGVLILRWLSVLQRRVSNHAERIAHLEGRADPGNVERGPLPRR